MRSTALLSFALSTLALFASANPEPCSDHPGVVHAPGEYTVPNVLKLTQPKPKVKHHKAAKGNVHHKSTKTKTIVKATREPFSKTAHKATHKSTHEAAAAAATHAKPAWAKSTKAAHKVSTPKVKHSTTKTVVKGASEAIGSFANASYIPAKAADALQKALQSAIDKQLASATTVTLTATTTALATETQNVTRTSTVANTTILVPEPTTLVRTITQNVTSVATSTLITTSDAVAASLDIKQALDEAFAAANLSQNSLDAATTEALEQCLTTVLASGGLPDGYSCLTSSGATSAGLQDTLNTILEQFVGILPNKILEAVFDSVTPLLSTLLPASESALVAQIRSSIQSVIASLSGNSVTALEQVSACYTDAVKAGGNSSALACYTKDGGAYDTLQTATNSVLEQFIGVLPASLTTAVENIFTYNLGNSTKPDEALAASVSAQISNAIDSVASSLSGNTVTLAEILQGCSAQLIKTGNATAAQECVTQSAAPAVSTTTVLSIAQQFDGYLPSSFFSDLVAYSAPLLNTSANAAHNMTQADVNSSLESFFNNSTSYGPAFVTCISQVEKCVLGAVQKSGTLDAVCAGPVDGCDLEKAKAESQRRLRRRSVERHFGFAGKIRDVTFGRRR
ncbi:hypothetical protein JCM8208_002591 [Rhodotorula glutinis]